ncbi:helix-turn-helix domain-containing protein [Paenibacillus qinlingensis]|uniref:helix-turn-helix domain-containing protein n=1 Tax=Paenibacillus qinlingensis TaxID=1837343 RepID=UPI0015675C28|nr:helix-turn-helix domain-containing protein [Paenibacillus qinlingensis]NQX58657.1 AraC family transcriptional regulator [Paenibacillus qinlingensis]
MQIRHFTAEQVIDPAIEAYYRIHKTSNNVRMLHNHEYYELHCVLKGTLKHAFADGTSQHLPVGSLLFIRPDDVHVCLAGSEEECEYINIAYSVDTVNALLHFLGKGYQPERLLASPYPPLYLLSESERKQFLHQFERIAAMPVGKKEGIKTGLRSILVGSLTQYFSTYTEARESDAPEWLTNVYGEMFKKDNFVGGPERMVELSGKSHHHVCREFKKYFQMTPTDFINSLRLNYAANMLAYSSQSVMDIAMDLHFYNLSYFHQLFKGRFGMSPVKYRKRQGT